MPTTPVLQYLHLSDLHFRNSDPAKLHDQQVVTESLLTAIKDHPRKEPIDFIIITGDLAFSGQREEYELALEFCEKLLTITGLPKERLYLVPGNHDVQRKYVSKSQRRLYRFEDQEEISDYLADPEQRPLLMEKFAEFNNFAEQAMGRRHYDEKTWHLHELLELPKAGQTFRLNLLGLNSALFAGYDGDDQQKLALGNYQVDPALQQLDDEAGLSIGFFHHPFPCFHAADLPVENQLRNRLDLILFGHLHKADNAVVANGAGEATIIGAGAAYETRKHRNSFNRVRIDLSSGKGEVMLWKYLEEHHCWNRDNDTNPHHPDGLFTFEVPAIRKHPLKPQQETPATVEPEQPKPPVADSGQGNIHFIHDYLLPTDFTGREPEQEQLLDLLQDEPDSREPRQASVISIQALGGMGKSALARKLFDTLSKINPPPYRRMIWYSFYESRSTDEAAGFRDILAAMGVELQSEEPEGIAVAEWLRRQLCLQLDQQKTLLVLDGMEVIQHSNDPNRPHFGRIRESHCQTTQLLRHLCNRSASRALITSRLQLRDLAGAMGFVELELKTFSDAEGANLLRRIGVQGRREELIQCARPFGGHPLALKAAGHFMQERTISASEVEDLIGDPLLFQRSSEGERVKLIVDAHREFLSKEQQHFLKMLSIHPRSVGEQQQAALLPPVAREWPALRIEDEVIQPLIRYFLIERLNGDNERHYSAHPLMKLAFATWLDPEGSRRAHADWAEAAKGSPALAGSPRKARSLDQLQPWLDVVEHYLEAGDFASAWAIWRNRDVDDRLSDLGYARQLLALGQRFEQAVDADAWQPDPRQRCFLYEYLGHACNGLDRQQEKLAYREKQYAAARQTGDDAFIVAYGALLAEAYLDIGSAEQARQQLAKIPSQVEGLSTGHAKGVYQAVAAKVELCAGNYTAAQSLFATAIKHSSDRNHILSCYFLGEAQLRNSQLADAEKTLQQALRQAEQEHIPDLIPEIQERLAWLVLKQQNPAIARSLTDQRIAMEQEMGQPARDEGLLLVQEGRYQEALKLASDHISTPTDEKLDKDNEIIALLVTAQAHHGLGKPEQAGKTLQQARALMEQTGCWRTKDWLDETETLLESFWFVTRIYLKNIRCFSEIDLTFSYAHSVDGNWSTILGENAMGKSTILRCIAIGLCHESDSIALMKELPGNIIREKENEGIITITLSRGLSETIEVTTRIEKAQDTEERVRQTTTPETGFPWGEIFICGYGANRSGTADASYEKYSTRHAVGTLFDSNTPLQNPESTILRQQDNVRHDVMKVLHRILMLDTSTGEESEQHRAFVRGFWGLLPFEVLSEGYRSTSQWVLDMFGWAIANHQSPRPSKIKGVIIIDEIEQHLHVRWQKKIMHLLTAHFPNIQFIVTTHSPLIVSGQSTKYIYRLHKDVDGEIKQAKIPEDMTRGRTDQILTGDIFGLETTIDTKTLKLIAKYQSLVLSTTRTDEETTTMLQLREAIPSLVPPSGETPAERRAHQLIELLLYERIGDTDEVGRKAISDRARELLETIGSSMGDNYDSH